MAGNGPFSQFEIKPLIDLSIHGFDISYSNSSMFMTIAVLSIILFFVLAMSKATLVPNRIQSMAEIIHEFVETTLVDITGEDGRKYFPIIFSIFMFVLICNLLGMLPYGFTVTSHIVVSFGLAILIFIGVTIIGIFRHGFKFLSFFLPHGTPWWLAPFMIVIELFSYLSRPVSLSVRLTANMIAGHILLKVLAGFIVMLGLTWGFLPMPLVVLLIGFEIFVAILQAYIFTILTCVYLSDALHLH